MKKLLFVIFSALFLGGCTTKDFFVKAPSGLEIATTPTSTVFLDGVSKGETPFSDKNIKSGAYSLKLVPISGDNLSPYETKLVLTPKASTIISRTFAESELDAAGYTLQLQEEPSGETFLSVISDPDTINVTIDDKPSGFTPLSKIVTAPGSHSLVVNSPGYLEQTLTVNTVKGYNLVVNFKLAGQSITLSPPPSASPASSSSPTPSPSASLAAKPSPSPAVTVSMAKPYVTVIDSADTQSSKGLNVRKDANSAGEILGKAAIGENLKYLGETTDLGWFKVEFEGNPGWVSGKYVTLTK